MANNINKASLIGCFFTCHSKEHNEKYSPLREGFGFDENGDLVYTPPINKVGVGCVNTACPHTKKHTGFSHMTLPKW